MGSARILIVDDDRGNLLCLKKILTKAHFEVGTATDGIEALAILEARQAFDVILLDCLMPGMNGIQLLTHIKKIDRFKHIPVVLQTVQNSPAAILKGLKAGACYYLTKPLDPKMVLAVVTAAAKEHACKLKYWVELERTKSVLALMDRGQFHYQTLSQCHDLAALLAKACPDPNRAVIGLSELMINALEHGNLGITYAEKGALIEALRWTTEVERRQQLAENRSKFVKVTFQRTLDRIRFRIEDAGKGFSWREYLKPNPDRLFDSHGRGIILAKWEAFDSISYLGIGNCVVANIQFPRALEARS